MIEQLASTQGIQQSMLSEALKQPAAANQQDVMRFNMALSDKKSGEVSDDVLLRDIKVDGTRIDNHLLKQPGEPTVSNPVLKLDGDYRSIMEQMNRIPELDRFLEIKQNDKAPAVRTNTNMEQTEAKDPVKEVKEMLAETRELYKTAGSFSKDISRWHIKTQIWSANIKILTTVVSQASQGFKTLFRSAG